MTSQNKKALCAKKLWNVTTQLGEEGELLRNKEKFIIRRKPKIKK
jgi:hypothetical protein